MFGRTAKIMNMAATSLNINFMCFSSLIVNDEQETTGGNKIPTAVFVSQFI